MKKLVLFIVMLLCGFTLYAQMPTDGDYSNWNWENQSQANWKNNYPNGGWQNINPPFAAQTERIGLMVQVRESEDYTKAKGWNLLWAQFDGDYPYFILYNSHKSIVRAFFYLEDVAFTEVLATLSFYDVNNPGILSFGNNYQSSTADYLSNVNSGTTGDNDMIAVVIRDISGTHSWGAADFPILFDNNIKNSTFNNKKWVFRFYGCDTHAIALNGGVTSDAALLEEQYTTTTTKNAVTSSNFSANQAQVHKQIQTIDKFLQEMQTSVKNIDTTVIFMKAYKNIVKDLKSVSSIVSAISGVSSGFSAVIGFFNLITGTFDDTSTKPAVTIQYIKLQGSMKIQKSLGGRGDLSIPGTNGTYSPSGLAWQPFHCPLGIINLQNTPVIKRTTPYNREWNPYEVGIPRLPVVIIRDDPFVVKSYSYKYPGKFRTYKLDSDITLTRQYLPGLELTDVQFAIVCKPNGTGDRLYKVTDKYLAVNRYKYTNGQEYQVPLGNPVYKELMDGKFIIHKIEVAETQNEITYFGTPFMDKNKLKGIVFEVPEDTDVKLAVFAKFQSDKYVIPILFKALYNLNYAEETANYPWVSGGGEQSNFPFSDYYTSYSALELNSTNNQQNLATSVYMLPGFVGNPGFTAEIMPVTKGLQNGNTVINVINFNCSNVVSNAPYLIPSNTEEEIANEIPIAQNIAIFPNPVRDIVKIVVDKDNLLQTISVYNANGQKVLFCDNVGAIEKELNMSALPAGMYIITLKAGEKTYSEKIILQK